MMKILSNPTIYAIRALIYMVSQQPEGNYVGIHSLAKRLDISFHLLTKTFQLLTRAGLLSSNRGPGGGVTFTRHPSQIYLIDVVLVLEGQDYFENCLLGLPGCGKLQPCPLHDYWAKAKEELRRKFRKTSLEKLNDMEARIGIIGPC